MYTFDRVAIKNEAKSKLSRNRGLYAGAMLVIVLITVLLTSISVGILSIIAVAILDVAAAGFFLSGWRDAPITIGEMFSSMFDENFLRKLGGMLWMELKTFLWSLLFIIPGIIKSLGYAMTAYILSTHPNVPAMEASNISERMMQGHKTELFITQLSFIGWTLLSAFTFGILHVVHVGPYMQLTYAGIFDELERLALENGVISQLELDGGASVQ